MNRSSIALAFFSVVLLATGCSGEKRAVAAQPREMKEGDVAPRTAVVSASTQPYREISLTTPGRISGTVEFDGVFPPDSVIQLTSDQTGCGQSVVDHRVERNGTRVSGVAVWITDIRQGKARPIDRRFELENEDCVMSPRIQTVIAGGTLNVISADVAMHRNRIIDVATGEMLAIAPFNDNGQVIPFDHLLTKTAELEVTCDLHPWTKAYVLVFDHPYYAVTGKSGDFAIEGLPPGTYHMRAWHPVLGLVDRTVTVGVGESASVVLKLPGEVTGQPPAAAPESVLQAESASALPPSTPPPPSPPPPASR
jgi:hypothetical protein